MGNPGWIFLLYKHIQGLSIIRNYQFFALRMFDIQYIFYQGKIASVNIYFHRFLGLATRMKV